MHEMQKLKEKPVVLQMECCQVWKMRQRIGSKMFNGIVAQVPDEIIEQ